MDAKLAVDSLAALAQESRLLIYRLLVEAGRGGLAVGEIGSSVRVAPATLSFHLKELAHAGLVQSRQEGRFIFYSANFAKMSELLGFLTDNCCARDGIDCGTGCGTAACAPGTPARSKPVKAGAKASRPRARRAASKG